MRFACLLTLTMLFIVPACESTRDAGDDPDIGTSVFVGDDEVRGYDPETALRVPATSVPVAKYPAVDIHCHWNLEPDPHVLLRAMTERNVHRAVNLSGGWGEQLDAMLARYHAVAPERLIIFCNIDFSRIDEPDFGATMSTFLTDAHRRGVRGLKIFKNLGLTIRDGSHAVVPIDDPRLDPIWATCGRLGMPVLIHSADPIAFFAPIDERNERWMQLRRHPTWSFHGPEFPARDEVLAQRNRVLARHPGTTFIGAHVGNSAEDLAAAATALDAYPNLVVDISGRVGELGRQPYSARQFFLDYQDRILFGTDRFPGRPDQPRYRIYYRFLETADEYFNYYDNDFPPAGEWKIYGVDLPDGVLEKVYRSNADRVLGF